MAEDRNWELNRIVLVTERNRFRDRGNRQRDRATEIMKAQREMGTMTSLEEEAAHSCLQKLLASLADCSAESSRIEAAKQIGDLAKTSAPMRAYLASAGVVPPLISILISSSSSSSRAKEAALLALLNLALRNQKNKVAIVRSGALPVLVEILRSRSEVEQKLRELAAAVLLTLSASDANKPEIGRSGATPLLVEILNSSGSAASSISIQAKVDAVMALYNLSTHPANVAIIQAAGAAAPLIRLLKDCKRSSRVAEKITALMETMMVGFDATRHRVVEEEEGGLLAMVEVLEEGTAQGKEHAVGALLALCENDRDKYRAPMLREGVIPGLLELTVEGTEIAKQKAQRLLCLLRDTVPASAAVRNPMAPASVLKSLVYDIAAHVDNAGSAETESAKSMLTEMVQRSMAEEVEEETEASQKKQQKEGSKLGALPSPTRRWGRRRLMSLKQ